MSSSGLIYAVIVGAWAAYLVPMWLRRQDELNEARPTERFSTAIRLLSGRAAMERRYAKDLQARSAGQDEPHGDPDEFTGTVDVRALAVPTTRHEPRPAHPVDDATAGKGAKQHHPAGQDPERGAAVRAQERGSRPAPAHRPAAARQLPGPSVSSRYEPGQPAPQRRQPATDAATAHRAALHSGTAHSGSGQSSTGHSGAAHSGSGRFAAADSAAVQEPSALPVPARREPLAEAAARAQRSKVLARRRRTTVVLFVAFTLGAVVAAVGGLAFLWTPGVPAVLLSAYIVYLRAQERRRFTYTMDRRRAEAAAQRLRERQPRTRPGPPGPAASPDEQGDTDGTPVPATATGLSSFAADRRALVEQTDHAEWVDQQRERQRGPASGDSWDPVPVPLPTYVTAPVAPRAGGDLDLGAPDTWSSARSSAAEPPARGGADHSADPAADEDPAAATPSDARRTASTVPQSRKARGGAPTARERGRTPLFDQYADGDRQRAAGQ